MAKITRSIIALAIAAVIAATSAVLVSTVKADAAEKGSANSHASQKMEYKLPSSTSKTNTFAKSYVVKVNAKTSKNVRWNATASAKNIKTKFSYNAKAKKIAFKMTGKSYGLTKFVLKYKLGSGKWVTKNMQLFVDSDKNIMRIK